MSEEKKNSTKALSDRGQRPVVLKKVRLVVVTGKDERKEVLLQKRAVTIGTLGDSDLALTDPTVSRSHAVVEEKADGYLLRDLGSTNGTFLDGVKVREAFGVLERVAPTDVSVLILGETGTGKELAARAIHGHSRRSEKPFVVFDCGAVAPNLIESELFGHEKGAFTDAVKSRQGAFELEQDGTIFLDEIGELTPTLQPKLLRALDQREIKRVGAEQPLGINVRVIAATNRNLEKEVQAGRFREDLYYRLSVVSVFMPPLRKRKEDIEKIAEHLLPGISGEMRKKLTGLSPEAAEALRIYPWPGNVRELKNVLERAAALSDGERIEVRDLFLSQGKKSITIEGLSGKTLEEIEKAAIHATLKSVSGNKTAAAKALGIAYSTLYEKMKKYEMKE